jgi:lipoate-protein ligase A
VPDDRGSTVNGDLLERHEAEGVPVWRIYEPEEILAVIGAAGDPARDLLLDNLLRDGVPYRFRRGGGGAVVLSPGQVVLALVTYVSSPFQNKEYAQSINHWFIEALQGLGLKGIEQKGISDLAVGGRKILGTSIYRRRLALFYQASLLVSNDISLFSRYLTMPTRVPDYRQGRDHAEFCTNLVLEGCRLTTAMVRKALGMVVERKISGLK